MNNNKKYTDNNWDFTTANTKEYSHCYHIYPAIMIPQVARTILSKYRTEQHKILFDPYCGSGTSLLEANLLGINNIGTDLNPLARLISRVKNTLFNVQNIKEIINIIESKLFQYSFYPIDSILPNFKNIDFWFSEEVLKKLKYIETLIDTFEEKDFFLLPFSETIRECSYTRNSEFKLFRIPADKIPFHNPDVFKIFISKCLRNLNGLIELHNTINTTETEIHSFNTCNKIDEKIFPNGIDFVLTSPPYGDSITTVAYGQFSRLTNQWLEIPEASKIDKMLMGGQKYSLNAEFDLESCEIELNKIKSIDIKRYSEVKNFLIDYRNSINNICEFANNNSIFAYVVGNRTVKGVQIPLDEITVEIMENNNFKHLETIIRAIPNKRMPSKNSPSNVIAEVSQTMTNEYIVICQKS